MQHGSNPSQLLVQGCEARRFAIAGDPRQPAHLRSRLRLAAFSSAIVLCDVAWTDPDPYDGVDEIDRCTLYFASAES